MDQEQYKYRVNIPMPSKKMVVFGIAVCVAVFIVPSLVEPITDALWFHHMGHLDVFFTLIGTNWATAAAASLGFLAVAWVNLTIAGKQPAQTAIVRAPYEARRIVPPDAINRISLFVTILLVLVPLGMAAYGYQNGMEMLRFLHRQSFGSVDPLFGKDVGFYVFSLPAMEFIQQWLIFTLAATLVATTARYLEQEEIILPSGRMLGLTLPQRMKVHLSLLVALLFLAIAWGYRLDMLNLTFSPSSLITGAGYADVHALLPAYKALVVISLFCAVVVLAGIGRRGIHLLVGGIALLLVLHILGTTLIPSAVEQFVVKPNELAKETPYIARNIKATRSAFGLDKIEINEFPAEPGLTASVVFNHTAIIENVKLWDKRPIKATYKQLQEIRLYYDFPFITVDRYKVNNRLWQVFLSGRELELDALPQQAQTWVNQHITFTHGYGICLSPVNKIKGEGIPDFWVKNIPPKSKYPELKVKRPEIYYGLKTSQYVLVKTNTKEFDYPKGSDNAYTNYQGGGGVPVGALWRRLLFAWRFYDQKLLFTTYLNSNSRIMFHRQVLERVRTLAPFLRYEGLAYLALAKGHLYWIVDAYTTTDNYPYSTPYPYSPIEDRFNYLRNSVKVVVDAYNGNVSLYVMDPSDPIIRCYQGIFPSLFKSKAEMPPALLKHIRYPRGLFQVQSTMYATYHMTDPNVFYNKEDQWDFPNEIYANNEQRLNPYYIILRLPEEKKESFLIITPFTPTSKPNMVAWMCAKCEPDQYGKLIVYTLPKRRLIYGPMQVEARINQDPTISSVLTLWGQKGSRVIRGDLLVIPIGKSLIYVEPVFIVSSQGELPELKRVIAAYGEKVAMGRNLTEALQMLFGKGTPKKVKGIQEVETRQVKSTGALVREALDRLQSAEKKAGTGDWKSFGEELQELKTILKELTNKTGANR